MKYVYIWGTGVEAKKCISNISMDNCKIMGYIETKPNKQNWEGVPVYAAENLRWLKYDYIIIANIYYNTILDDIRERKLADESRIVDWLKMKECIYYYSEEIWMLFSQKFIKENFYIFNIHNDKEVNSLPGILSRYDKVYVYDLRLINSELDVNILFSEIINNVKNSKIGMAFIPRENLQDENWYHNLMCVLDKNAFVIWRDLEGAYADYIISNPEKFSFARFGILQFVGKEKRVVHKGRYMLFDTEMIFKKKHDLIDQAKYIKITLLRCDRIGEEIRVLNRILVSDDEVMDSFRFYIPIDGYGRPFEGTNACFNELVGRRINLLRNKDEYALWIQDIFEKSEKYMYDHTFGPACVDGFKCGIREMYTPFIDFSDGELIHGKKLIADKLGLTKDYVCLFTRDAEYLNKIYPDVDSSYHNYRDVSFDIMNKAIDYFNDYGIQTIRMGQITKQQSISNKCVDFVRQGYDEFLDLSVHRYCKFFIGSASGIAEIANVFGRPAVWLLPSYPLKERSVFYVKEDLCIFNRIFSVSENRELSFLEIFNVAIEFCKTWHGEYFIQHGLELIPFTEDDILDVAIEMNDKLDGSWKYRDEDIELHKAFNLKLKTVIDRYKIDSSFLMPISVATSFLRRYRYLLEDNI